MIKINRVVSGAVCLLLALLLIAVPVLATCVGAAEGGYDYSRPASAHNVTVSSDELLATYLGSPLSDAERDYLALHGGIELKYDNGITTSVVATHYENGTLEVSALEYSYTGEGGSRVAWIPKRLTLGADTHPLSYIDGSYRATVDEVDGELESITVCYELDLVISPEDMSALANKAYMDAPTVAEEISKATAEYQRLKAEYDANVIAYDEYLKALATYESEYAAYTDYLSRKKIYDDAYAEYTAYLKALSEYEEATERYEEYKRAMEEYNIAYESYKQYLSVLAEYNGKKEKYDAYIATLEQARAQLSIIDAAKVNMTNDRQVYSAIMGSLVDFVIDNKDLITSGAIGVNGDHVDMAGEATESLRELLTAYFSITEERDKYAFYQMNFDSFKKSFTNLLLALDSFYSNRKIRSELKSQDKQVKYVILVAQLVYISNALNDGAITSLEKTGSNGKKYRDTLDKNYKITYTENGSDVTRTVERILEYDDSILPCDSPLPLENGYPTEVAEPTIPPEVTKPVLPQAPKVPAMPQEVDDPGEPPAVVIEPIKPTLVEAPGEEPPLYIPPAEKAALVEAYNKGIIINREEIDTPYTFTATQTVQKRFKNVESVTVFFYPDIDKAPYTVQVDKGTRADYEGELPTKSEDDRATYAFSHWVDKEGNRVDLSAVNEDVVLYPYFAETVKCYDITFIVDGNETVISLPYGAFPLYDGTPFRADDEYYEYTFSGWDRPLTEVTGDASYSACFGREYILAYSGGGAHITLSDGYYIADCASSMAKSFDLERLIKRATAQNVRAGIILRTNACELTISYSTLLQMQQSGDTVVSPSVVQNGIKGYKYSVAVLSSLGEEGGEYRMQAKMPCKLTEVNKLRLYDAADTSTHLTFTAEDGGIAFSLLSGRAYQLSIAYDINIIGSNMAQISADCEVAAPGSTISVSIDLPNGIMLDRIYLVYPDGAEHTVTGGKFKMPSFDVSLGVECSYIEYVIKFTDDTGRVLSTQYLKYGDTVAPPSAPVKASDSKYSYTFYGWSSPITDVDGDKVYKAVFTATRLPEKPTDTGLKISPGILRLLITGLVGICMLFLVVIPWSVITIVFVSLEKKRHIKADGRSKE